MARRETRPDPKEAALAEARCLNPHPEQVTDPEFLASDFFDARDAVQVKYEMVRKVQAGGVPVTEAAAAFGYSRPAYYAGGRRAGVLRAGRAGAGQARAARRHKLTEEILAWAEEQLAADPALRPAQLAGPDRGGLRRARAPPLGRASAGPPPGAPLQKPLTCPPARCGRRITRPCPCSPSPGHAAAEPGTRLDAGQDSAPGGGLDARYEQLRHAALHARAEAFPLGLGVLARGGVTAWRHALAGLAPAGGGTAGPPGTGPAPSAGPDPVARFIPAFADARVYLRGSAHEAADRAARPSRCGIWHLLTHTSGLTYGFHHTHAVDELYRAARLRVGHAAGPRPRRVLRRVGGAAAALPARARSGTTRSPPTSSAASSRSSRASRSTSSSPTGSSARSA